MTFSALFLFTLSLAAPLAGGESTTSDASADVLNRYLEKAPQNQLRGVSMEVDFEAKLPKLKKEGTLHALRIISKLGHIRYIVDKFTGDSSVKKDVIARYMSAETQAQEQQDATKTAITPDNYKFRYKGLASREGQTVHVFQLNPKKKRVGLFKGELWLDPDTCLPVRESGRFVKSPSIFLRKVEFVRDYRIQDGRAVPTLIQSLVDTRFWGKAELKINFTNVASYSEPEVPAVSATAELR